MCAKAERAAAASLAELVEVLRRLAPPRNVLQLSAAAATIARDWIASAQCAEAGATHLWVGESGTVTMKLASGETLELQAVVAGVWHPIPYAARIVAQTTSAKGVVIGW